MNNKTVARRCACAIVLSVAAAVPCHAVTISYVGTEPGTFGSGYATPNWSNAGVAKQYATGTSNKYGKDGYWQLRPIPYPPGANTIYTVVGNGNDLGTSAGSFPTLTSGTPSFLSGMQGYAGDYVNFQGYAIYKGPDGTTNYTQGGLSVPVNQGPFNTPSGANTGYFGLTMSFALNYPGTVRVGIAVDSVADGTYAPNYVGIYTPSLNTTFSQALTRDGTPDMAVFDIVNPAGETFTISQWQLQGTNAASAMSLVTFDVIPVPEPSALGLLVAGSGAALGCRLLRRRP